MIHVAVLQLTEPSPDGDVELIFASLDGESYLPINRRPEPDDEESIAALFEGDGSFRPMRWARRALHPAWLPGTADGVEHFTVG